jgi:hypothetical protein
MKSFTRIFLKAKIKELEILPQVKRGEVKPIIKELLMFPN